MVFYCVQNVAFYVCYINFFADNYPTIISAIYLNQILNVSYFLIIDIEIVQVVVVVFIVFEIVDP